jgi:hypothetical protein
MSRAAALVVAVVLLGSSPAAAAAPTLQAQIRTLTARVQVLEQWKRTESCLVANISYTVQQHANEISLLVAQVQALINGTPQPVPSPTLVPACDYTTGAK